MPLPGAFQRAEAEHRRLTAELAAGRLTSEQCSAALDRLLVEHEGRFWTLGATSGRWYVHDGHDWREAQPPDGAATAAPTVTTETSVGAAPGERPRYCPACGTALRPGGRFCAQCGLLLDSAAALDPPPARSQARGAPEPAGRGRQASRAQGCLRRAVALAVIAIGLTIVAFGLVDLSTARDRLPLAPGLSVLLGFIVAVAGAALARPPDRGQ